MADHDQEIVAVRHRTTLLQDRLREAIQRVALESRSPGGSEAENEHECLLAVRNSLDDLGSIVTDLSSKDSHRSDKVDLLHVLERTRHELFALASRGLTHAEREKAVLQEVLEFVEIKEGGDVEGDNGNGSDPAASYYDPIYSTPPQAADRIVGPKRNRLSPTSVLFDYDASPRGYAGLDEKREAAEYFDRRESSPSKKEMPAILDDRHSLGASEPLPAAAHGELGIEHQRRGGVLVGIGRLIRLGFFIGGVGYILSRLHPRGFRRLGRDVVEMARDHPLVVRAKAFLRKHADHHAEGTPQRAQPVAAKAAARRPYYSAPPAPPADDVPSAYVAGERSSRLSAERKAPALPPPVFEPDVGAGTVPPDIFFGQG